MRSYGGFYFRRIDISAASQNHVSKPITKVEVSFDIQTPYIAKRFPTIDATFWLGSQIVICCSGAVFRKKIDFARFTSPDIVTVLANDS